MTADRRRDDFIILVRTMEGDLTPAQERRQQNRRSRIQANRRVCATWLALLLAGGLLLPGVIAPPQRPPVTQETA
jgi:hypothetical protein